MLGFVCFDAAPPQGPKISIAFWPCPLRTQISPDYQTHLMTLFMELYIVRPTLHRGTLF